MKLGISGMVPRVPAEVSVATVDAIRQAGFSGAAANFGSLDDLTPEACRRVRSAFADGGVELVELGMYGSNLVHPGVSARARDVAGLRAAARAAAALGGTLEHGPAVITGSGSLNPNGQWFAHPENTTDETIDRLVASLKEAAKAAADEGVLVGLECHTFTVLSTPEIARRVVDSVGAANLKVHLDPVNWIAWETIYRTGDAIRHMFEVLPPRYILGAHAKGIEIEDRLAIHMNEVPAGVPTDRLDYAAYLTEMAKLPASTYLVVEHTPLEVIPLSRAYILARAKQVGVRIGE